VEKTQAEIITSPLLERLPWIEHGFGTRRAPLSQDGMASLKQIHSAVPLVADRTEGCIGEGDALITAEPGVTVSVRTADCFPVLLVDMHHHSVAAVHAGWRGTADGVVMEALRRMRAEFGANAVDISAAIGPGIGACCYEVGEEVARRFGLPRAGHVDLAAENLRQLTEYGVPREQITVAGACTFCDRARFYSWRRDRESAGRMISYIRIKRLGKVKH
jgi:YfiH family protein